ncbi:hypothetical protein RhiirA4_471666 [Rhizophagus irregularis]|uniref:Uncharacterized protein n=1 Tax=Rhizophagus irregularis TaxID=588596 RepID=A0A2I1H3K1_9GLOM|nr:hypothetical protein RhiirA4_471666 [Rhizophagus irregularis]
MFVRRNTKNSTDVKDYTTLKKKEARRRTYQEWNDEEDEVEKNVGHTRQINKEDEVESDKSESDREKEIKLIYVVKGGNKNKKNKKSVKK